jgi:hypothetical protein
MQIICKQIDDDSYEAFKQIPSGKDGFGDWWPPVVYQNETEEYVWAIFEALYERWCRLMQGLSMDI